MILGLSCISIYLYISSLHLSNSFSALGSLIFIAISFLQALSAPPCAGTTIKQTVLYMSIRSSRRSPVPTLQKWAPDWRLGTFRLHSISVLLSCRPRHPAGLLKSRVASSKLKTGASAKGCKWAANISQPTAISCHLIICHHDHHVPQAHICLLPLARLRSDPLI